MPAGHGTRARTRDSFSRPFRGKGYIPLSVYLRTYRIGDYVDIKVNSAVLKVLLLFLPPSPKHSILTWTIGMSSTQPNVPWQPAQSSFAGCCRVCHTRCITAGQASFGTSPSAQWAWR